MMRGRALPGLSSPGSSAKSRHQHHATSSYGPDHVAMIIWLWSHITLADERGKNHRDGGSDHAIPSYPNLHLNRPAHIAESGCATGRTLNPSRPAAGTKTAPALSRLGDPCEKMPVPTLPVMRDVVRPETGLRRSLALVRPRLLPLRCWLLRLGSASRKADGGTAAGIPSRRRRAPALSVRR
jgi:hypothetical protein